MHVVLVVVAVTVEMWRKIRDATGEHQKKRSSYLPQSSDQSSTIDRIEREREREKEKDQANLRRADDLFSHKQYSRYVVKEKKNKIRDKLWRWSGIRLNKKMWKS